MVRRALGLATGLLLWLAAAAAMAQAPDASPAPPQGAVKLAVDLQVHGDENMRPELQKLLDADAKGQDAGASAVTILQRAQGQRDLVTKALRAQGYYGARVAARAAGHDVDDVAALDAIEALPAGADIPLQISVETGPRFMVRRIDIVLEGDAAVRVAREKLPLQVDQPAVAAKVLASDDEILGQLQREGYALARIVKRDVVIDHDRQAAHVTWRVATGGRATMGPVTFRGLERTDAGFVARRVPFKEGEPYHPGRVEALRARLSDLGIFSSVRIIRAPALDSQGGLPIEVELVERPPRTIGFSASYATSEGAALRAYWVHRNLTGEADSLRLSAELTGLIENELLDTGFAIMALYRKPDFLRLDQVLSLQTGIVREITDAYRRRSIYGGGGLERTVSEGFVLRAGLGIETEIVRTPQQDDRTYLLFSVPMAMTLDRTDNKLDPSRGFRLALDVIPYFELRNAQQPFVKTRATASTYVDLAGEGATVIALRASIGIMPVATRDAVPPDKRFYAGGGGSVRGFEYQTAGPRDSGRRPLGGNSVVEGSVELRQRFTETIGAVAFIDAGTAYAGDFPGSGDAPRIGVGVGLRYYTAIGPIRADIAYPVNRRPGDSWFGFYVSIGQAF
jgi:translocation and assembly module TamA